MQRDHNNHVTHFPILIPCSADERQGEATFDEWQGPVREVTAKDFDLKAGRGKFLGRMQEHEHLHLAGIVRLLKGIQNRDQVAVAKARAQLSEARAIEAHCSAQLGWKDSTQLGQALAPSFGLQPGQAKEAHEIIGGYRLPPRIAKDSAKVLSLELSSKLRLWVNLVLWWTGTQFTPALYCTDPKVAPYVYFLIREWSVCPHCGEFFEQQRSDQDYCTVAHREAHRVARWRAMKKSKSTEIGAKRGTRKTR